MYPSTICQARGITSNIHPRPSGYAGEEGLIVEQLRATDNFGQGYGFIGKKLNALRGQSAAGKTRGSPERFLDGRDFTEPAALAGDPVEPEPILTK